MRKRRDPGADRASEVRKAFEAGGTNARVTIETMAGALKEALATIAARDKTIAQYNDATRKHIDDVVELARKSTEVIVLQTERDLRLEEIKRDRDRTERLFKLLEQPVAILAGKIPAILGATAPKTDKDVAAKRAFEKIMADRELCERLTTTVGLADWTTTIDWAVSHLG